jgi:hypothetical protein
MQNDEDLYREMAVTVTQFVLSPDIPVKERAYFQQFYVMFSKIAALGFIQRYDILAFKITYKMVAILLENGVYDYAHELMGDFLMTLQLSRSVGGFWTLYGQKGVDRQETIQKIMDRTQRSSLKSKVRWMFGNKKEEPQGPVMEPEA